MKGLAKYFLIDTVSSVFHIQLYRSDLKEGHMRRKEGLNEGKSIEIRDSLELWIASVSSEEQKRK